MASFGRLLAGSEDALPGYRMAPLEIVGPQVLMALHFASRHSDRLKSLTVLGAPVEGASSRKVATPRAILDHGVEHWARRTMMNRLGTRMPAAAHEWWAKMMGATAASTQAGFLDFLPTADVRPELHLIRCPVLIVTSGSADNPAQSITSLDVVNAWTKLIPRSRVSVIPNDSFHVAATDPDAAAQVTLAFIAECREPPPGRGVSSDVE